MYDSRLGVWGCGVFALGLGGCVGASVATDMDTCSSVLSLIQVLHRMVLSQNEGTPKRPQYILVLVIGTPQKVRLI